MNIKNELNNVIKKFNQLKISEQYNFKKIYLYSIITHSTAIEGSTIREIENMLMFDEGIIPFGHNLTEQLMNLDLKKAYDYVIELAPKKPTITIDLLKKLSSLVMKNTGSVHSTLFGDFDASNGDLRKVNVSAGRGGKSYLNFQKIPNRLDEFCKWINKAKHALFLDYASIYEFSFEVHYRLVSIHPWVDGNGRTSRLLMNMIQLEHNLLPSIIPKEEKANYIEALSISQDEDNSNVFIEFMMKSTINHIKKSIEEFQYTQKGARGAGIEVNIDSIFLNEEIKDKIKSKDFKNTYSLYCKDKSVSSDNKPLDFMKEVVKELGIDTKILTDVILAVTDVEKETPDFTAKLLQATIQTDEYKQAFEKEQGKVQDNTR